MDNIKKAIEDIKNGKMILITDDQDRENEGDLICAAQFATTELVNFMATHAKGLICMPMSRKMTKKLGLEQMVSQNTDNHSTAFTVSIDHIDTTTGISAVERSLTAIKCCEDNVMPDDFRRPGHMFPLEAKDNGVLVRNGHTEATVDLCKLAGLKEIGLCCEIMNDDGTMMRADDLETFAKEHDLTMITIKDLVNYIKKLRNIAEKTVEANLPTKYGDFRIIGYENIEESLHHLALVKGDVENCEDVLVRVHSECLTGDVFGSVKCDCGAQLDEALRKISEKGQGAIIYLRQEGRGIGLINKLKAYELQDKGMDTVEANLALGFEADLRDYEIAANILKSLKIKSIQMLTNNPDKITSLENHNIKVSARIPIETAHTADSECYMKTKKYKMGHILETY